MYGWINVCMEEGQGGVGMDRGVDERMEGGMDD